MDSHNVKRYEAVVRPGQGFTNPADMPDDATLLHERESSKKRMEQSYQSMMDKYAEQQAALSKQPGWVPVRTKNAEEPHELTVTHVNQTKDLYRAEGMDAGAADNQTSEEWLRNHSIEQMKLTLKDLVNKGKILRPISNKETGDVQQHIQFEAIDINEFEYKLNLAIESYTKRIKWLLQGSKKTFGLVRGNRLGILIDCSDANFGFGRVTGFQESLIHLLDEQISKKKSIYLAAFGSEVHPLWSHSMDVHCRSIEQAKEWVTQLKPRGGCNLLKALKHIYKQHEDINTIMVVLGSVPDQSADALCSYIEQLSVGQDLPIFSVAYDCNNSQTNVILRRLSEQSSGNFHCYATASEQPLPGVLRNQEQIYTGTDISLLLGEIQRSQGVINKIREMRQGLLGTALVTVMNEITNEVAKLPQSRFLPRPPGHELPLQVDVPQFIPSTSEAWLGDHGLKAKGLDLYQVLSPNAYSYREEFIPVIRKTVQSQVHEKAMAQFQWHDGSIKNIHVDMTQLFEYQKQLGATVKIYEKRIDWLSSASRKIFGTITGENVVILVDLCLANTNYLAHIQHSMRLLLEQQMANKEYFNVIAFGAKIHLWKPTLVKPTLKNLQECWRWLLDLQCSGSRDFMGALRAALENDEEAKHNVEVDGVYLFASGIPDQPLDVCTAYLEEACAGRSLMLHAILFNVDDYNSQGAIPSRYANITKTAEILRILAHSSGGRFHWFRETGIIESDDIAAVSLEVEKALNFSKKCAFLVESVKKKYNLDSKFENELRMIEGTHRQLTLPPGTTIKALPAPKSTSVPTGPPPKHTALSQARMKSAEVRDQEEPVPKALAWRPSSAKKTDEKLVSRMRPQSAKDPMQRVKNGKKSQQTFFYTDGKNNIGAVYRNYPSQKSVRKGVQFTAIPDKEDQLTSKQWLRMFSLNKLKLDLNKLVSGPDCKHVSKPVKTLNKVVDARTCNIFPTVNIQGTLKHLQLLPNELKEYEEITERVLRRYLKRLQWLLSGSRRVFGSVVEKKVLFLLDTSGSMDCYMDDFKKELASLIWDQFHKYKIRFNMIRFSKDCERWQPSIAEASENNCHDAVKWVSYFVANGNTCTLEALQMAFEEEDLEAIYLLTDGKPDTSTSLVLHEVASLNTDRNVTINTISFNCDDSTANNFLKMLASETGGRYHHCHHTFDADLFAHKLLNEGFVNHEHPALPDFESDDLRHLGNEITKARRYLAQSRSYRAMYENLREMNDERGPPSHNCVTVGLGANKNRPQSAKP